MPQGEYSPLPKLTARNLRNFSAKVDRRSKNECWPWKGGVSPRGYGRFRVGGKSHWSAHRLAFFITTGIDPGKLMVCHECDNPPCCNPAHLSLSTALFNQRQSWARGRRSNAGENSNRAKLTWKQVEKIREEYDAEGLTQRELAEWYGLSRSAIRSIVNYENWIHTPTD